MVGEMRAGRREREGTYEEDIVLFMTRWVCQDGSGKKRGTCTYHS